MGFWFEFDSGNKILLLKVEGRFTDELLAETYQMTRKHCVATDANMGIWDYSSVTDWALSAEAIRNVAGQEPAMADATKRPRVIMASGVGFGLSRMFQIVGETTRPLLKVVRTRDEAFAELGVQSRNLNFWTDGLRG